MNRSVFGTSGGENLNQSHQTGSANNGAVKVVKNLLPFVRNWFVTGTPFESSPEQMAPWVQLLDLSWKKDLPTSLDIWPCRDRYRGQLKDCGFLQIKALAKIHKKFVQQKNGDQTELNPYVERLSTVLETLWSLLFFFSNRSVLGTSGISGSENLRIPSLFFTRYFSERMLIYFLGIRIDQYTKLLALLVV